MDSSQTTARAPVLLFQDVNLGYGDFTVLSNISLAASPGEVVAIMGGSGSGKTTLLRAATGQLRPFSGKLQLFGQNVEHFTAAQWQPLRQRIGVLFQHGALFTDLNVFENVAFPLREHTRLSEPEINKKVLDTLEAVGLRAAAHLRLSEVSGGMARRIALARAVIRSPELVLYDEPFAGLDPISMGITARLIRRLSDQLGCASVLITHDVNETFAIADRVYIVGQGQLKASGTPAELKATTDPYVEQFLNGLPDGPVAFDYPVTPAFERWARGRGISP